jgi:type IV pilus assembly protein PilC
MYTTTLLAGERSGNLLEVLERYVSFQRISLTFRKKLITSLIYPCVLMVLVTALVIFMFAYVVPQFATLYDQLGSKLPAMTIYLLNFSEVAEPQPAVDSAHDCCIGRRGRGLPVLNHRAGPGLYRRRAGASCRSSATSGSNIRWRCLRARLSTLLTGGLPLVPSLETAARSISSRRVSKAVVSSITTVREGKSLAEALTSTKVFPDLAAEMITVGEQTGALPQMLNSVAEFFEEDVATALTASLALIEPAILIIMGIVVVFILISLYLPIFSLGMTGGNGGGG